MLGTKTKAGRVSSHLLDINLKELTMEGQQPASRYISCSYGLHINLSSPWCWLALPYQLCPKGTKNKVTWNKQFEIFHNIFIKHLLYPRHCIRHCRYRVELIGRACLLKLMSELNESCPQMHNCLWFRVTNLLTCFKLKVCLDLSLFLRIFTSLTFMVSSFLQKDFDRLANSLHWHF